MSRDTRGPLWLLPVVYYLLFLLLLTAYWLVFAAAPDFHAEWLQDEDHLIEWLTFMSFFMAFVFMVFLFQFRAKMGTWSRLYLLGITLFFFVCAGEEISWAQRVLGFSTPEGMIASNEQQEFNLHNLNFKEFHPQAVAALFMEIFGIVGPVVLCASTFRRNGKFRRYLAPLYMVPCFLFAESLNNVQRHLKPWIAESFGKDVAAVVRSDTHELTEMFWGLCCLLSAIALYAAWERYQAPDKPDT